MYYPKITKSNRFKVGDKVIITKVFSPYANMVGTVAKIEYSKYVAYGQFEQMQIVTVRLDNGETYKEHERYLYKVV